MTVKGETDMKWVTRNPDGTPVGETKTVRVPVIHYAGDFLAVVDIREVRGRWDRDFFRIVHLETGLYIPTPPLVRWSGLRTQRDAKRYADNLANADLFDQQGIKPGEAVAKFGTRGYLQKVYDGEIED